MQKINTKKGISLIVLVITIIVMIILAAAIILSLNNAGIIGNANKAVEMTNEAQINQIAQLGWAEAYASGARTVEELKAGVENALTSNGLNPSDYVIAVTTKGVDISTEKAMWVQEGLTVKKGDQALNIGDTISYDAGVTGYTKGWKVLGASDKGELLIVSADNVTTKTLGGTSLEKSKTDYITGAKQLDDICATYVNKEKGATGARSIRVEDINNVTGYNPETAAYGKNNLWEYGNKVTYSWSDGTKPTYTSTKGPKGTLTSEHNGKFIYYNGTEFVTSEKPKEAAADNPIEITKLDSNYYWYYPTTLKDSASGTVVGIGTDTKAYKMLFRDSADSANSNYWLASPHVFTYTNYAGFGLRYVDGGRVNRCTFVISYGLYGGDAYGVRAVVSLSSNIQVKEGTTTDWKY